MSSGDTKDKFLKILLIKWLPDYNGIQKTIQLKKQLVL
jgi:hypothetical protein